MKARKGFTLVEILIVVVILGILAAVVIPQFTDASTEAKTSSVKTDLQTVRAQIELYKIQHNDALPSKGGASFIECMTGKTDVAGDVTTATTDYYGPYMQKIPTNGFNNSSGVSVGDGNVPDGTANGWYFNNVDGTFKANDSDANHAAW